MFDVGHDLAEVGTGDDMLASNGVHAFGEKVDTIFVEFLGIIPSLVNEDGGGAVQR